MTGGGRTGSSTRPRLAVTLAAAKRAASREAYGVSSAPPSGPRSAADRLTAAAACALPFSLLPPSSATDHSRTARSPGPRSRSPRPVVAAGGGRECRGRPAAGGSGWPARRLPKPSMSRSSGAPARRGFGLRRFGPTPSRRNGGGLRRHEASGAGRLFRRVGTRAAVHPARLPFPTPAPRAPLTWNRARRPGFTPQDAARPHHEDSTRHPDLGLNRVSRAANRDERARKRLSERRSARARSSGGGRSALEVVRSVPRAGSPPDLARRSYSE